MASLFGLHTAKATAAKPATGLRVQSAVSGKPLPLFWGRNRLSGNLIWYGDFVATANSQSSGGGKGGGGGGGGKGGSGSSSYTYSTAVAIGIANTPVSSISTVWDGTSESTLSHYNLTLFGGSYTQAPWGYLSTKHASQAIAYHGLAYVGAGPMSLGSDATLPSLSYDCVGPLSGAAMASSPDASPAAILTDLLTNAFYGLGFPTNRIGDLSGWSTWCLANGLMVSPVIDSTTTADSVLTDILDATASAVVWAGGLLTVVPYGDTSVTGNGATWTAPSGPAYTLSDTDFNKLQGGNSNSVSSSQSNAPLQVTRKAQRDAYNDVWVEYWDRSNAYNPTIVEAKDEAAITAFGLRPESVKSWHFITTAAVASTAAQLHLGRQSVLTTYAMTVGQEYILLDPMDVVALIDPAVGLSGQWVRITEITENGDGTLTLQAEEFLNGPGAVAAGDTEPAAGWNPAWNAVPSATNTPILLAAPPEVAQGLELWLIASGSSSGGAGGWGGCGVYLSADNATYTTVGNQEGPAIQGVTTVTLPAGSDPDTADTLSVDLSQSGMILLPVAQADADLYRSLCWIANPDGSNGEFIAYRDATLSGSSIYTLGYLRRGLYGTAPVAHPAGSVFARLDGRVFAIPYTAAEIGSERYIKLPAFNIYGSAAQDISAVTATAISLPAPPAPPAITGFTVAQSGNDVVFQWTDTADWALKGYDILYGPVGGSVDAAIMLTEASRSTEMTNASVPPGSWTFYIQGRDQFGQTGPASSQALTVSNVNSTVATVASEPGWLGTLSGLLMHYTGVLVPDSAAAASVLSNAQLFTQFVPVPVAGASYTAPAIDTGTQGTVRAYATVNALPAPGSTTRPQVSFLLDTWADGATDPGTFTPWGGGSITARYFKGQIQVNTAIPAVIAAFDMTLDAPVQSITMTGVAIAAGGTAVVFPRAFHTPPAVQITPSDGTSTGGGASAITPSGCTVQLFQGAALVAGTCTLTITGN